MIFFKKEKEVIELIEKHAEKVEECLATATDTLQAYLENDIPKAKKLARQADNLETQADMIRHKIRDKLYYGAYMPLLREDIYKLVESLDKVANFAEECCDFFLNQRPEIPDDFKSDFSVIIEASLGVGEPLKHSVMCYLKGICPVEVSRQHAKDIGLIESKVDGLEWDLSKKIFSSDLDYSHKIHLRLCIDRIVEVSDRAEDSADQLELVTLKAMI
jgi:predicted phosphate transport protein (TIGR00153 family)